MIRKKKLYSRPMKPFESFRIAEENKLVKEYGLKSKREVWKSLAKVNYFKKRAMALAKDTSEEQNVFFNKLKKLGLKVDSITDVLGLKIEDLLNRRLTTIIKRKGLANSVKQARQMVVHKKMIVKGEVINSPSYIVSVDEENDINIKKTKTKEKKAEMEVAVE